MAIAMRVRVPGIYGLTQIANLLAILHLSHGAGKLLDEVRAEWRRCKGFHVYLLFEGDGAVRSSSHSRSLRSAAVWSAEGLVFAAITSASSLALSRIA